MQLTLMTLRYTIIPYGWDRSGSIRLDGTIQINPCGWLAFTLQVGSNEFALV